MTFMERPKESTSPLIQATISEDGNSAKARKGNFGGHDGP